MKLNPNLINLIMMKIINLNTIRKEEYDNFIKHDQGTIKYFGIIGQLVMNSPVPITSGLGLGKFLNSQRTASVFVYPSM